MKKPIQMLFAVFIILLLISMVFVPGISLAVEPPPLKGDVDGNDRLTLADGILSLQIISDLKNGSGSHFDLAMDVNNDFRVGMEETIYSIQMVSGLRNGVPVANGGADRVAYSGLTLLLDGSTSTDPDNDYLLYNWTIEDQPEGALAILSVPTSSITSFIANAVGTYSVSLIVDDRIIESEPHLINVTVYDGAYLAGRGTNIGVILCHGRGTDPTWLVVDPLRKGINEQLGYHTLSLQMPKGNISWDQYDIYFPDAYQRIEAAIQFLQQDKGVEEIFLMGHSMGSRMATAFLANYPNSGISGFIGVGIRNNGGIPLDSNLNLRSVTLPVVDIYGNGGDGKDAVHASTRSDMVSNRYQQILVPGADHVFTQLEDEMVTAVVDWLRTQ